MQKKIEYLAYYSLGLVGYEVGLSNYGETASYCYMSTTGPKPYGRRAKIRMTTKGGVYFLINSRHIHLDECLQKNK